MAVARIDFHRIDFVRIDFGQKWVWGELIYVWIHYDKSDSYKFMLFGLLDQNWFWMHNYQNGYILDFISILYSYSNFVALLI